MTEEQREYQRKYRQENKEKLRAYWHAHHQTNREKDLARSRAWNRANKEKIRESGRAWRAANKERKLENNRRYVETNREQVKAYQRAWREKNKEKLVSHYRAYRQKNLEKMRRAEKKSHFKRTFGITIEEHGALLAKQNGLCAICNHPPKGKSVLHLDHDHKTKRNRALLCNRCNMALGLMDEDVERLHAMMEYLKKWSN